MTYLSLGERFWSKVNVGREDECWDFRPIAQKTGYGKFAVPGGPKETRNSHVVAYWLAVGSWPKERLRHSCENRACCNPNHLYDSFAVQKERAAAPLAPWTIARIRDEHSYGRAIKRIRNKFSVGYEAAGKIWKEYHEG